MKRAILLILFVCLSFSPGLAQEVPLSADEALAIALRDNRLLLLKRQDVEKAKLKIAESQSGLFPTLDFTGGWTYTAGYYTKDISQTAAQFSFKQYLYQGGKVINSIKYDGQKFEVARAILDKTALETILDVYKTFYTLLLSDDFVRLNEGILDNSRRHLEYIRARYEKGESAEADILKAEASLAAVEQACEASKTQRESAQVLLNNLLYLDKDVRILPVGDFDFEPREAAFDEGFLRAMRLRPEIRQFEAQTKADKSAIEVAKAEGRPKIYASWDYYSRSHAVVSTINTKNWNDYNIFGIAFSWPIFDGWQTKAKVEQAIVDLKKTQLSREQNIQDIVLEVKNAYLALRDAIEEVKAAGSDLSFYEDNLATAKERYRQGEVSLLDKEDAALKYAVSSFNREQALYDYTIAKFNFEKATGGFNEA